MYHKVFMPKTPIDYSKTIIYRIVCKDPTIKECYVGSTTDFTRRKSNHKTFYNNPNFKDYNMNVYQFIRNNGGWDNFDMIEVEKYNAVDKLSQSKRERYWLEFYKATLNTYIPSRTEFERNTDNTEYLIEYRKKYYEENKQRYNNSRSKNKNIKREYDIIYRENNKDKLKETRYKKITCECGSVCSHNHISRHKTTKKHLAFTVNAIHVCDSAGDVSSIGNEPKT